MSAKMSTTAKETSRVASRHSRHSLGTMEIMEIAGKFEPLRLLHRLLVFAIALWYVGISVEAFVASVTVLRGLEAKDLGTTVHQAKLIATYAGRSTINKSPLVQSVLSGSTEPRNDTIYLETESSHSFTGCSVFDGSDSSVYSNTFTRFLFTSLQHHAADNLTYLQELELIAPVVDCTFDLLVSEDEAVTQLRVYYLTRWNSTNSTLLLSTSMSTQDFEVTQQYQSGAALFATIAAIDDMQATEVAHHFALAFNYPYEEEPQFTSSEFISIEDDNYWMFNSLPRADIIDPAKEVRTAYRTGGYIDDPVAQSNFEIVHWNLPNDPATELKNWN